MKTCGNFVGDFFFFFSLSNSFQVSMALEIEFKLSNTMVLNSYIEAEAGKTYLYYENYIQFGKYICIYYLEIRVERGGE